MSRKHRDLGDGGGGGGTKAAVWDTGSSLYDSYELAAVHRLIDRRLLLAAAAGGEVPLSDDAPAAGTPAEGMGKDSKQQAVVARARRGGKVTLRALFRAAASWAVRPSRQGRACACVGMLSRRGAVEPVVSSHGEV